ISAVLLPSANAVADLIDVGQLAGRPTSCADLNDNLTAACTAEGGSQNICRWESPSLSEPSPPVWGVTRAVNNTGAIAGYGSNGNSILWTGDDVRYLETPSGCTWTDAEDINDSGEVVGVAACTNAPYGAVLWQPPDYVPTRLSAPPLADWTWAW